MLSAHLTSVRQRFGEAQHAAGDALAVVSMPGGQHS